jgi:hypothetical protein
MGRDMFDGLDAADGRGGGAGRGGGLGLMLSPAIPGAGLVGEVGSLPLAFSVATTACCWHHT